jgi:hypothetical protein
MKLKLANCELGMATSEIVEGIFRENEMLEAACYFEYQHPPLLQDRVKLTKDEELILDQAVALRASSRLPFWEALMLSCFDEPLEYSRLLEEAAYHQPTQDTYRNISRKDVLEGALSLMVKSMPLGNHLSLASKVTVAGDGDRQLPLLDFHCPESELNDGLVKNVCAELLPSDVLILSSGESYHVIFLTLLTDVEFRKFLVQSLLFAPVVDARYVAHQLLEGACALRLSTSHHKPSAPKLKAILRI